MSVFRIAAAAALSCVATAAWAQAPAPASELLYAPLNACRIAKTSSSTAGIFKPGTTRAFRVRGSTSLAPQGGSSTGCAVPAGATAIAVSATVDRGATAGYLAVNDADEGGRTRFIQWRPNTEETATAVFPLASPGTEPALRVTSSAGGNVNLTLNVVGYYIPPIHALISTSGGVSFATTRVLSVAKNFTGVYDITVDRDINFCAVFAQPTQAGSTTDTYKLSANIIRISMFDFKYQYRDAAFFFEVIC